MRTILFNREWPKAADQTERIPSPQQTLHLKPHFQHHKQGYFLFIFTLFFFVNILTKRICRIIILEMLTKIIFTILIISVTTVPDWTKVNDLFNEAIIERAFPGATVIVANQTQIIYRRNFGFLTYTYQLHDVEVGDNTLYDIDQITTVMATTFCLMSLVSSSTVKLNDLVTKWVANYDTSKKGNTTIANLLLHNSGLPAYYPGPLPDNTKQVLQFITFAKPEFPVGTKYSYSSLGFLLLGQIIAAATKKTLNNYFEQNKVFANLKGSVFNPVQATWYTVAPTQYDTTNKKKIIRGFAHQKMAQLFGGVAGHSGLFTTADDLIRFMRIMLSKGKLPNEPSRILPEAIVTQFTSRIGGLSYENTRAYGFNTVCPSSKMSNCFGHDGSTGAMAWADKDKKIVFAVISNKGHPNVDNALFDSYKPKIADAIMAALGF